MADLERYVLETIDRLVLERNMLEELDRGRDRIDRWIINYIRLQENQDEYLRYYEKIKEPSK
jgi:hypothetical protein